MENIYVVTDSTADIPSSLAESLGITVVPLKVHFENEEYLDGVTITVDQFYEKLATVEKLPTTSQPSPLDFVETYKKLAANKPTKIISIHLSAALSGTVQSAMLAKEMVKEEGIEVEVIDSKKASYSIGIIVVGVAKALKNGMNFTDALALANKLVEKTEVFFLVDTLTYLQKGGRIGKAASMIGSLLNIKPILSLNEKGEVYPFDKVRGQNKAFKEIIRLFTEYAGDKQVNVGISHAQNPELAAKFTNTLKASLNVNEFVLTNIGPVIGTHVGPGTVAIMMYTTD